jgi:hypothetical protein
VFVGKVGVGGGSGAGLWLNMACGMSRGVENRAFLGCYVASNGNSLSTFRGQLSVPYSRVTSLWNYHYSLRNNPEKRDSHPLRRRKPEIASEASITWSENISLMFVIPDTRREAVGSFREVRGASGRGGRLSWLLTGYLGSFSQHSDFPAGWTTMESGLRSRQRPDRL